MKALLLKDFYVADKQMRLLFILALIFTAVPMGSVKVVGNTYAMMIAFMLPLITVAYDERCRWDRYAAMLPCKPVTIVWSKYVLSYLGALAGAAIILIGAALGSVLTRSAPAWGETLATVGMLLAVMLLLTALGLPMCYRFGSEKGRIVMIVLLAVSVGGVTGLMLNTAFITAFLSLPVPVIVGAALALAAALTALSVRLSLRFYLRRRDGAYA